MSANAIAGFLALGHLDTEGEFEEVDYPRTVFSLGHHDLGFVPEITAGPDTGPIGQMITTAGIFTEEAAGILLLSFGLVPPYTVVPQSLPTFPPRLHLLASIEHTVNATMPGGESDLTVEPNEPIGTIDGQVVTAHIRLTVVDGGLVVGGLSREERAAEQVRKLAATRARKAVARAAFLERTRLLRLQLRSQATATDAAPPAD